MERLIFHIDVNSAFVSWEAVRRVKNGEPDIRLIPSAVGGDPNSRRSIIAAKSIPAKKYGIVTGEAVSSAIRKCPTLLVVPADFDLYKECSKAFKDICRSYAPVVEEFSIDECFLNFTGTGLIYPDPINLAYEIKDRIRDELGFTVNVGVARNKVCAKMASDFEKPDKVHTLFPDEIESKMWPLPVGDLLFIGKSSAKRLNDAQIRTIGDLANADIKYLETVLGKKMSIQAKNYANGIDFSPVSDERSEAKSFSHDMTLEYDVTTSEAANRILLAISDKVSERMRRHGAKAYCVAVTIRYLDFTSRSHQKQLAEAVDTSREVYEAARQLMRELWTDRRPLRLISITLSNLTKDTFGEQFTLFESGARKTRERDEKLDKAMDDIKRKYGSEAVRRAGTIDVEK